MVGTKKTAVLAVSILLSLVLVFILLPVNAFAESAGVVTGNGVNVRSGPGTGFSKIGVQLNSGHSVTVLEESSDAGGGSIPWYRISFVYGGQTLTGYMRSDYVSVIPTYDPELPPMEEENPDFETQLAAFPEDYKAALTALHQQHPSWNFVAYNTGLDWASVQALENRLGWSYINDGIISHYSTAPGAYDWETDTYFVKEGRNWYQAHPDMVAYYMDPRNFLNETDLFQFELLAFSPTSQTEENIAMMLSGTFMEGKTTVNAAGETVSYARAFLDAASTYNVSAFHLVARCIQEVGWGGSACSLGTYPGYEGYYNFFNIGAYNGAGDGMIYAKNNGWNTPYKAILAGGSIIGNNYIARGQNTPYYQKYNVVDKNNVASHQYMTNVAAALSEGRIQKNKYISLRMLETGFTFSIPVYNNMPATPCAAPVAAGSPNNYLTNLTVDGYALTPTFDFYDGLYNGRVSYALSIRGGLSYVTVGATAASGSAVLSGDLGTVSVSPGVNTLTIHCTAANGTVRTYTITLNVEPLTPAPPTPIIPPEERERGDLDGVGGVNIEDAIYLLFHFNFPDTYVLWQSGDFDGSGTADMDDAIYLLFHTNFPESYPLY
ncbi:MAG: hypothetical protein E7580_02550 [Ruminococcaceae bacterium]|nr:hypothetical protein [Oscillospiraceae bacterium]